MDITVTYSEPVHIIVMSGRWDAFSTKAFDNIADEWLEQGMRLVVLDLSKVDYISSFGLRSLLTLGKQLEKVHGKVCLSCLEPSVAKVFFGSGFDRLFDTFPTAQLAIQKLKDEV